MTRFEDRLLNELEEIVAGNAKARPSRWRTWTPRFAVAGLAAAALTIGSVTTTSNTGNNAWAVSENSDGSVTIQLYLELDNLDGLERSLRAAGVRSELDGYPNDKRCATADRWTPSTSAVAEEVHDAVYVKERKPGQPMEFTIDPGRMASDETLVIDHREARDFDVRNGDGSMSHWAAGGHLRVAVARGEIAPCELVDGPLSGPDDRGDWPNPPFECVTETPLPQPGEKLEVVVRQSCPINR
jgi:hypothetical protein